MLTAFAPVAMEEAAGDALSGVAITTDMLKPIVDGITANIGVILPVGISIFSILIGISLIPKIIKYFRAS